MLDDLLCLQLPPGERQDHRRYRAAPGRCRIPLTARSTAGLWGETSRAYRTRSGAGQRSSLVIFPLLFALMCGLVVARALQPNWHTVRRSSFAGARSLCRSPPL